MIKHLNWIVIFFVFACAHKTSHKDESHHGHALHGHSFKDAKKWSKAFDDPARDEWQRPDFVIKNLDLKNSQCVADIGAGTGYFSKRIAKEISKNGTVYAVDNEPDMIEHLKQLAAQQNLTNHKELLADSNFPLFPIKCDLILLVDTYHHIDNRENYFKASLHQLTAKARVAIIDFTMESPYGPQKAHRFLKSQVIDEMSTAGYKVQKDIVGLPYQYFLIFERK